MKEDRLRELEEWLRGIIKYAEGHFNHGSDHKAGKIGLDLITYVRQLEKDLRHYYELATHERQLRQANAELKTGLETAKIEIQRLKNEKDSTDQE